MKTLIIILLNFCVIISCSSPSHVSNRQAINFSLNKVEFYEIDTSVWCYWQAVRLRQCIQMALQSDDERDIACTIIDSTILNSLENILNSVPAVQDLFFYEPGKMKSKVGPDVRTVIILHYEMGIVDTLGYNDNRSILTLNNKTHIKLSKLEELGQAFVSIPKQHALQFRNAQ